MGAWTAARLAGGVLLAGAGCQIYHGLPPWDGAALAASIAKYDGRCDAMSASLPEPGPRPRRRADALDPPVPRRLHLLDLGTEDDPRPPAQVAAWRAWAAEHGWLLAHWTLADEAAIAARLPAASRALTADYLAAGEVGAAEDLVRYSLLAAEGGVVIDRLLRPPSGCLGGALRLRGLTLDTDWLVRNYGEPTSSVQVAGLLIAAPPEDPTIRHLEATAVANHHAWMAHHDHHERDFTVGKVFLNRSLGGAFQVLPAPTLEALGMHTRRPPSPDLATCLDTIARRSARLVGMRAPAPPLASVTAAPGADDDFRDRPIPRQLHQIWFGDRERFAARWAGASAAWRSYGAAHGLAYRLWTEADDPQLRAWAGPVLWDHLALYREWRDYRGASDIARYLILKHQGGAYFDLDLGPPRHWDDGPSVDFTTLWPMRGLVVVSDSHIFDYGNSAIYPMNAVLLAAPHHPVIDHMLASIPANHAAWQTAAHVHDPVQVSGPALLARSLGGSFQVVSRGLWRRYFMRDGEQPDDGRFTSAQKRRTTM